MTKLAQLKQEYEDCMKQGRIAYAHMVLGEHDRLALSLMSAKHMVR